MDFKVQTGSADNQTYSEIDLFWMYTLSSYMPMVMEEQVTAGKESDVSYDRLLSTTGSKSFKREPAQEERGLQPAVGKGKRRDFYVEVLFNVFSLNSKSILEKALGGV